MALAYAQPAGIVVITSSEVKGCSEGETGTLMSPAEVGAQIEALARAVQALPPELRWWQARESLIASAAVGADSAPGPNERRLRTILAACDQLGLGATAARLAVLAITLFLWLRQTRRSRFEGPSPIFVGIKALREAESLPVYAQMVGASPTVVDSRRPLCMDTVAHPGLRAFLAAFRDATEPVMTALRTPQPLPRFELLAAYVMRGARYCYLLAAFRDLAERQGTEWPVACTTADLAAFAAVRAGHDVVYFPHGFLRRSLVFPDFCAVVGFNVADARHVESRLGGRVEVSVLPPPASPIVPSRCLAIVADYFKRDFEPLCALVNLAKAHGYSIAVRPHPAGDPAFFAQWDNVTDVVVDREGNFEAFIRRHRPAVMATWFSTTIFDAVVLGVVPVTLSGDMADIVFPTTEVALVWPDARERLEAALTDEDAHAAALGRARQLCLTLPETAT